MHKNAEIFDQIVNERRSVRIYDAEAPFDEDAVKRSIERATLAPNSSNMQLWEFYRIKSPEAVKKMAWLCLNQSAAKTAREMVVVVARRDLWKKRQQANLSFIKETTPDLSSKRAKNVLKYYEKLIPTFYWTDWLGITGLLKRCLLFFVGLKKPMVRSGNKTDIRITVHKTAALAAQNFMMSMKAEGYDTCPMEGMDSLRIKRFLKLPRKAEIVMVISCGPAAEGGIYADRFRVPNEEVIFEV